MPKPPSRTAVVRTALRDLRVQLALLNHQVGSQLSLKDAELDCLDVLARDGALTPSALARRAGIHPATMTGILDRLERGGWVVRDRDQTDRRRVTVRVVKERTAAVYQAYRGMNGAIDKICAGYSEDELDLIAGFLNRCAEAGHTSTEKLAAN
ncbi:MarR family winged helix-turn-helix transcriptional regulator [Kribbella sindirgiensis]|uniref:MarR family transcriptional regulator n=1 Tax=Kribbella sindirgiensis TaxID=1124744 RepID=A0A4R0IAF2_9ACTN|nr:MarR family transcriptional regulator [Kribbella sindirgiensis]TCC28814.1 MarR family transcriptional regulator [Kribbella sindirgiensis]